MLFTLCFSKRDYPLIYIEANSIKDALNKYKVSELNAEKYYGEISRVTKVIGDKRYTIISKSLKNICHFEYKLTIEEDNDTCSLDFDRVLIADNIEQCAEYLKDSNVYDLIRLEFDKEITLIK